MYVPLSTLALAASILSSSGLIEALSASEIPADTPISSLLSSAQAHLSKGQTSDALRATTYLSLGRTSLATEDFNKVLTLRPGFEGAHIQLAKIKSRSADWEGAKQQYILANQKEGSPDFDRLTEAQGAASLAEAAAANGNWDECIGQAGEAIQIANRSPNLRDLRSRCRFEKGEVEEGMGDLHHIINMKPGDITPI
ncbi:DnaJ domain-containing protein [Apiospora hydei]|uniref:DnaJ domain-containing protein n=1 Tax=Apiospora hydei TaxID=1337664 RepID=A0ABR1WM20_9PEZI